MLESTPGMPYGATLEDLLSVEGNMKFRYVFLSSHFPSIVSFLFPQIF